MESESLKLSGGALEVNMILKSEVYRLARHPSLKLKQPSESKPHLVHMSRQLIWWAPR